MDRLGGLIHNMPATALTVLTGCAAISALPPLNGFASEWLMLQAILLSPELPQWGLKVLVPASGALLALAATLAAACFIRMFGISFLGRPRTLIAQQAHEVDIWSRAAMIVFAVLCVVTGILPGLVVDGMSSAVEQAIGAGIRPQMSDAWLSLIPVAEARSSYNGLLVFAFITASALLAAYTIHLLASKAIRRAPPWDCGFPDANPITQYSAGSFEQPIRRVYGTVMFGAREHVSMPPPGAVAPAKFQVELHDLVWEYLYAPISGTLVFIADRMNVLQFLTIRRYLTFVFLALIALLLVLAL